MVPTRIEAVVKVSERCNINCSYCYFFNKGNDDFRGHPAFISEDTVGALAHFLRQGALDVGADRVVVDFHGGEPLLMKPARFARMCEVLKSEVGPVTKLVLNVQTNATTIDDRWIDVFARHSLGVGISLDGPEHYNDAARIDHKGRGTYRATARGIERMRDAARSGLVKPPGALCVINPSFSARTIYRHFVDDLGFRHMDFLLPIESHDSFDAGTVAGYARFLTELFEEWAADDDPGIKVRILDKISRRLAHGSIGRQQYNDELSGKFHLLVVASNGDLRPDDQLLPLNFAWPEGLNVRTWKLAEFLELPQFAMLGKVSQSIPSDCVDCCWKSICRGGGGFHGRLVNQYSVARGFDNRSILCDALQEFYATVCAYLVAHGISWERIMESLADDELVNELDFPRLPRDAQQRVARRTLPIAVA